MKLLSSIISNTVIMFIILFKVAPTFEFVDETLKCCHSNKNHWLYISCDVLFIALKRGEMVSYFNSLAGILNCDHSDEIFQQYFLAVQNQRELTPHTILECLQSPIYPCHWRDLTVCQTTDVLLCNVERTRVPSVVLAISSGCAQHNKERCWKRKMSTIERKSKGL